MTKGKTCTRCGQEKPLDEFAKDKRGKHGRRSRCNPCRAEQMREWHAANRDSQLEYKRAYRAENPEVAWLNSARERARATGRNLLEGAPFTRQDVVDAYEDACYLCGGSFDHLDHVYGLTNSPTPVHSLYVVRPICDPCNRRKGAAPIAEHEQQLAAEAAEPDKKWCGDGKHMVPLGGFNRDTSKHDGRRSWCRECCNARERARRAAKRQVTA